MLQYFVQIQGKSDPHHSWTVVEPAVVHSSSLHQSSFLLSQRSAEAEVQQPGASARQVPPHHLHHWWDELLGDALCL